MPFRSRAQLRLLYSQHPDVAKRWEDTYGIPKNLPEHVARAKARVARKKAKRRKRH